LHCQYNVPSQSALIYEAYAFLDQLEPEESAKYDEDHWRKDALEKLIYAAQHFRLGVYSAEELEIFENRGRAVLARWGSALPTPQP